MFWKKLRKTKKQIAIKAAAKQRAFDEKFWTVEIEKQRKRLTVAKEQSEENIRKETSVKIKNIKQDYETKLLNMKYKVIEADQKVRDAQSAWLLYKDWIPKALNCATTIRSGLFLKQQEITRAMGTVHGGEDDLELLQEQLIRKSEKIEKLLHFEIGE